MKQRRPPQPPWTRLVWAVPFVLWSLLAHIVGVATLQLLMPYMASEPPDRPQSAQIVILEPAPEKEEEEEDSPDDEDPFDVSGQIVEIAPPDDQTRPEDAEYLAEYDSTVLEETKTIQFEVNPEVVANIYSQESTYEQEDIQDLNIDEPSTGAQVGNDRFDPDRDGNLASLPSKWTITNKDGLQAPVPSSHKQSTLTGAPQNDLLDEKRGDRVALNAREFVYASYINRIKRLVNFYWKQNVDNLPSSVRLVKPQYTTDVDVVLNSDGALDFIAISDNSGSGELDDAVVRAFRLAGPFPNPPSGLISKDGRVYLPEMGFTVMLGQAKANYQGVDPRAGVQFPGILKSPR